MTKKMNNNNNNNDANNNNNDDNNGVSEVEPVEFIVCLLHDFAPISVPDAAASLPWVIPPFSLLASCFLRRPVSPAVIRREANFSSSASRSRRDTDFGKKKKMKKKLVGGSSVCGRGFQPEASCFSMFGVSRGDTFHPLLLHPTPPPCHQAPPSVTFRRVL